MKLRISLYAILCSERVGEGITHVVSVQCLSNQLMKGRYGLGQNMSKASNGMRLLFKLAIKVRLTLECTIVKLIEDCANSAQSKIR